MKKKEAISIAIIATLILAAIGFRFWRWNDGPLTEAFVDNCVIPGLNFQQVIDTTHIVKSGNLQSGLIVSGKTILTPKIKLDSIGAYIRDGDKLFYDQTTLKVFKVTQEFWEEYTRMRSSYCALISFNDESVNESVKNEAAQLRLEIVRLFSGIDEKKELIKIKLEQESNKIINSVPNSFYLNISDLKVTDYSEIVQRIELTSGLREETKYPEVSLNFLYDSAAIYYDEDTEAWTVNSIPVKVAINKKYTLY